MAEEKRYGIETTYASINGTGECVYWMQSAATDDDEVTEYAVKRRMACKTGVLWFQNVSHEAM